uniref:Knottin scorpion toxin-like domain-containing protein n=1 Tax=Salix viminalis TaxID=40686 RepID=A0A6N2K7Z3_SALVM
MTKLTFNLFFIVALVFSASIMVQDVQAKRCKEMWSTKICYPDTCRQMCQRPGRPGLVAKCNFTRCLCQWDC